MEQIVRIQRGSVSDSRVNQSRSWAKHELMFVQGNYGREDLSNQGLEAMLHGQTFDAYTAPEIDQRFGQAAAATDAAQAQLKADLIGAISELPVKIFPQEKEQAMKNAILEIMDAKLSQKIDALREELKAIIAK